MRKLPRLVDMIGPDEPKRMSCRRIAADARPLAFSEPIPLVLGPIVRAGGMAADAAITFDRAVPQLRKTKETL